MARNKEKHAGRLNRLWLQRLDEENAEKNPTRPGLGSLHTAEQVKKWMPSIKKDIDFYLKQSQVGCYPERIIGDFSEKIESLTKEYKAYLRKYRSLGGDVDSTPWSDQPYSRKHKITQDSSLDRDKEPPEKSVRVSNSLEKPEQSTFVPISLPIMDNDDCNKDIYTYSIINSAKPVQTNIDMEENNEPLQFNWNKSRALEYHSERDDEACTEVQNEPSECMCVTNVSNVRYKCSHDFSDKCSNGCSNCSSNCLKNVRKCLPGNPCRLFNCEDCRNSVNDIIPQNKTLFKSDTSQEETNLKSTSLGNDDSLNQVKICVLENTYEGTSASKQSSNHGNVLNLPYSDSSGEDDS